MDITLDDIDQPHHVQSRKSYHNSLAPVSRLPYILLTDIFILIHCGSGYAIKRSPPCLQVSHVCRAWRNAALQCPLLWTNILFCPPEWAAVMLERSRTAPLTVEISIQQTDLIDHTFVASVQLALSHIHHIRSLCIILFDHVRDLDDLLSPFLTGSPDILEELKLYSSSVFPNYTYPSMENAPCLRSLELSSCHINWQLFSSVGNLTSLLLNDIPVASRPSIEIILSLLQTMNKLENLSLIHAISELPPDIRTLPPNDVAPLKLEKLFYISLTGFVLDCANLMRHLNVPRCRWLNLKAVARWHIPEVTVPPLIDLISSAFSQLDRQESPYGASINRSSPNVIEITAYPHSALDLDSKELGLYLSLSWRRARQWDGEEISTGFGNLLSSLPLGRVVDLSAESYSRCDHTEDVEWLEVLPRLCRAEKVVLVGRYTYGFANAFDAAHAFNVSSHDRTDAIVLPNLTSVTIQLAHFSFPLGGAELFSTLKRALTRRLELEWTVPNITLLNCHITQQQLAVLNTLALGPVDCIGEPQTCGIGELDSSDESDED